MALIKCPRCTSLISELTNFCPSCDLYLSDELIANIKADQEEEKENRLKMKNAYAGTFTVYR